MRRDTIRISLAAFSFAPRVSWSCRSRITMLSCRAMDPRPASPHKARPLAPAPMRLVLAVAGHPLSVGARGGQQTTNNEPTPTTTTPASTDTSAMASGPVDGAKIYADRCVLCHGPEGKGDGPAAAGLNPKPRNHTDGTYMKSRTDA